MTAAEFFTLRGPIGPHLPVALRPNLQLLEAVCALARFGQAGAGQLCFCDGSPPSDFVRPDDRSIVLCGTDIQAELAQRLPLACLAVVDDPRAAFIDLARALLDAGILDISSLVPAVRGVDATAAIGSNSVVHPEARLDGGVVIGANCVIQRGVWLQAGARVGDGTVLGAMGINAYRAKDGRVMDFPHLAGLVIGEGASIGSNAVLVRGILTSTHIGRDSVIGNLCNIGHGVEIGDRAWMSAACCVGGHTKLGRGATLGIGAVLRDNLVLGDEAQVGMGSVVVRNVPAGASVFGNPARAVARIAAGPAR